MGPPCWCQPVEPPGAKVCLSMVVLVTSVCTTPDGVLNLASMGLDRFPEAIGSMVSPEAGVAFDVPTQTAMLATRATISPIANNLRLNILESPFVHIDMISDYLLFSFV